MTPLLVQRNLQFFSEQIRVKRAACEKAPIDFQRRNFALAIVRAQHELFRIRRLINIYFAKRYLSLAEELFRAPAIAAPACRIHSDFSHSGPSVCYLYLMLAGTSGCRLVLTHYSHSS